MQFIILALTTLAAATPARLRAKRAPFEVCPAIDTPQCCQVDVDGILALTCSPPTGEVSTAHELEADCAAGGLSAFCCTVPIAGDALLCSAP